MAKNKTDIDRLSDEITRAIISNTFFMKVENIDTHVLKHVTTSNIKVLDRVLSDNVNKDRNKYNNERHKTINSGFISEDDAYMNIEECILFKSGDIADWVLNQEHIKTQSFEAELPADQGYEPVGYGYVVDRKTNTIDEFSTQTVRVVLERDNKNPLGFSLLTAYPDIIRSENRIPTGIDISETAKQTDTYKNASPVGKGYIAYQTSPNKKPYLATFKNGDNNNIHDDVVSIHIPFELADKTKCEHVIRLKENQMMIATRQRDENDRWQKVPSVYTRKFNGKNSKYLNVDLTRPSVMAEFEKRNPEAARIVKEMNEIINPKVVSIAQKKVELNERYAPRIDEKDNELKLQM